MKQALLRKVIEYRQMDERIHKEGYLDFDEYIRQGEPSHHEI